LSVHEEVGDALGRSQESAVSKAPLGYAHEK
jgi:hypothetical protein